MDKCQQPLKIGIVGGGFSGTAMAAMLHRISSNRIIEVTVFEKSGKVGRGPAYSTPFDYHLLNVRAEDMSPFEDDRKHFSNWVHQTTGKNQDHHFVPRVMYANYLQSLIQAMQTQKNTNRDIHFSLNEIVDIHRVCDQIEVSFKSGDRKSFDKVILAIGNNPPSDFPFPISDDIHRIDNPWDYTAVNAIPKTDPVLIVGTGLSMIDAVLSLHHQGHQGKIHVLSRHGLLPLRHADGRPPYPLKRKLTNDLRKMSRELRGLSQQCINEGGDWRTVINAIRADIPTYWQQMTLSDRKQFLRHVLPYWNIHRHRVHVEIMDLLSRLAEEKQLVIYAGRVKAICDGEASIQLRHQAGDVTIPARWVINCMGPVQHMKPTQQPIIHALISKGLATLEPLCLGFHTTELGALIDQQGSPSTQLFTLGPPAKGTFWECTAVPEIRQQIWNLARHLLD